MVRGQGRCRVDAKGPLYGKVDRAVGSAGGQTAFSKERNRFSQKSCQGHGEVGGLFLGSKEQEGEGPRGGWICCFVRLFVGLGGLEQFL